MKAMQVLALDPSINHLGWARMSISLNNPEISLIGYGTIHAPEALKSVSDAKRIEWMINSVELMTMDWEFSHVVIERPETWGAYKSTASTHAGSMMKLQLVAGALFGMFCGCGLEVELVKVTRWKGQLPKHVTEKRMKRKYKISFKTSDEADAVGLGDWFILKAIYAANQRKETKLE